MEFEFEEMDDGTYKISVDPEGIEDDSDNFLDELICIKCHHRWVALWPDNVALADIECPHCRETGGAITTGEDLSRYL